MAQLRAHNTGVRNATTRSATTPGTAGHGDLTVTWGTRKRSLQKRTGKVTPYPTLGSDPYNYLGSDEARARREFYLNRRNG